MNVASFQKDILIGTILGDAYLQKTGEKNARLRLEHGAKQKEYLFWKVSNLQQFFQGKPKYLERVHPRTHKTYMYWRHQSQTTPFLGKLRKMFYPDGKKVIPEDIEKFLNARSIAVWYMDDGYYYQRDRCAYIYLGNVTREAAERISHVFNKKFQLATRVLAKKKGFAIYFPPSEVIKLKRLLDHHILNQFKYKLPL